MSKAEELLGSMDAGTVARLIDLATEPHIVINEDRTIFVPTELRKIGVQYDHNIETVTFDCPRYWDGHDLSAMQIYINYMTPDNNIGAYLCSTKTIDDIDENVFHFEWTISSNVTLARGNISFLICAKAVDEEGNELRHWNSELNKDMYISQGMECVESVLVDHPDIVTQLLTRMDAVEAVFSPIVELTETETGYTMTVTDVKGTHTYDILHGAKGDAFKYEDFTEEQLAALKGEKGDAFEYEDFTEEQLAALKGEKGDAFKYEDFTEEQLEAIKGEKGDTGLGFKVIDYYKTPETLKAIVKYPNAGDAYGVGTEEPYDIYIYGGTSGWKNYGPLQGAKGEPGKDGYSPVKGVDYWTEEDKKEILGDINPENVIEIEGGAAAILEGEFGEGPYEITITEEEFDGDEDIVTTGNIQGKEVIGEQLRTTSYTHRAEAAKKFAVLDVSGYIQHRTPAEVLSDIGALGTSGGTLTGDLDIEGELNKLTFKDGSGREVQIYQDSDSGGAAIGMHATGNNDGCIFYIDTENTELKDRLTLYEVKDGERIKYRLYHEGNKPTAEDIGAAPVVVNFTQDPKGNISVSGKSSDIRKEIQGAFNSGRAIIGRLARQNDSGYGANYLYSSYVIYDSFAADVTFGFIRNGVEIKVPLASSGVGTWTSSAYITATDVDAKIEAAIGSIIGGEY